MLYYIMQGFSFVLKSLNDTHQTDTDTDALAPIEVDHISNFPIVYATNCRIDPG
ncbi:hypothetical protein LguiB_031316 [Lonicera macranthoides]